MNVQRPTVGPIVGRTSHDATHIFIRGDDAPAGSGFGVLEYRAPGQDWSPKQVMPLDPARDQTCVFDLGALQAAQKYEYRAGWTAEAPADETEAVWPADALHWFHTSSHDASSVRNYAIGSCRHLSKPFAPEPDAPGDEIFGSIRTRHENGSRFDAFFMLGDQIYADPVKQKNEYLALYRCSFGRHDHLRRLMSRVPTYMILDDHEIQENWPAGVDPADRPAMEAAALEPYRIYQCSHNPDTAAHLWYRFADGCADWFVMDTRSQRKIEAGEMIDQGQLAALLAFLGDGSGRVKMVATTVPIFPDHAIFARDKWQGFTAQRRAIFDHIRARGLSNVVFVSGDVHCSFVASLELGEGVTVHTIVCSPFVSAFFSPAIWFWSFWLRLVDAGTDAKPKLLSDGTFWRRNFAHVRVEPQRVLVSFYDRAGAPLQEDIAIAFA